MDNSTTQIKLMSEDDARKFLQSKFNATYDDLLHWFSKIQTYNYKGEKFEYVSERIVYRNDKQPIFTPFYERDVIEKTDFVSEDVNNYVSILFNTAAGHYLPNERTLSGDFKDNSKKISRETIDGKLISGLEAAKLIRKKYKKFVGIHDWTIDHLLGSLRCFEDNGLHESGYANVISNKLKIYESSFYLGKDVSDLILIPEYQYINIKEIVKREHWINCTEKEVLRVLLEKNDERILQVFDPVFFYPGCDSKLFEGKKPQENMEITSSIIPSHFGTEAQILINKKEALFRLSEVMALEEELFVEEEQEEPKRRSAIDVERQLMEEVYEELKKEPLMPKITQTLFANRMYKKGVKHGSYPLIDEKDREIKEEKEKSVKATIIRKLSKLDYAEKKKSLEKMENERLASE